MTALMREAINKVGKYIMEWNVLLKDLHVCEQNGLSDEQMRLVILQKHRKNLHSDHL